MTTNKRSFTALAFFGLWCAVGLGPRFCEGITPLVTFGPETARADLLNKVSERVFSLVETGDDGGSPTAIVKTVFTNALKSILSAVKGEVHEACNELVEIATQKIQEAEQRGELSGEGESTDSDLDDLDFSFMDSPKKTESSIRPHGFLQETKFMDTLKTFATGALKTLAEPMKEAMVQGIKPILPKIKDAAIHVFREACQDAEQKLEEA
ncbi:microneme protein MIC11 [Besnoitia besnoiti]|uniref:Microneme protein MIC11 n=1 Tax=Besnoitia besnoiti TaxID=94643 RepID=A0A2A9MJE4_BESBE|nr:microneme protein MIC11 [Besnoitia besnoiti]PFH35520.1 microneme protein MIC11 [Besnoitia besnoiti]